MGIQEARVENRRSQKTYWHLLDKRRMPTEYELATSNLYYYIAKGFEVNVPLRAWHERYQQGSRLTCRNWERFYDPRETTYTTYTSLQTSKELFVDGLLESIEQTGYDKELSEGWLRILERVFAPLRYPGHGFQMIAAYVGQMAPSGRITVAGLFQAADEIRRVQRIAYRIRQLQLTHPGFGETSKSLWQQDPLWQPLREAVEKLLVTYDWAEALVGLNLVLKPIIDELLMVHFGHLARGNGDYKLQEMLFSLDQDCQWHRTWAQALVQLVMEETPDTRKVIQDWVNKWYAMAARAVTALAPAFGQMPEQLTTLTFSNIVQQLEASYRAYLNGFQVSGFRFPLEAEPQPET